MANLLAIKQMHRHLLIKEIFVAENFPVDEPELLLKNIFDWCVEGDPEKPDDLKDGVCNLKNRSEEDILLVDT